jgi:hypothetical protein
MELIFQSAKNLWEIVYRSVQEITIVEGMEKACIHSSLSFISANSFRTPTY